MFQLPKSKILRGYGAFSKVLTNGRSVVSGSVRLFYAPITPSSQPRVGFSVARNVRRAITRNRIKRCLRESFRLHVNEWGFLTAHDVVFLYKTGKSEHVKFKDIEKDVAGVMQKLKGELKS